MSPTPSLNIISFQLIPSISDFQGYANLQKFPNLPSQPLDNLTTAQLSPHQLPLATSPTTYVFQCLAAPGTISLPRPPQGLQPSDPTQPHTPIPPHKGNTNHVLSHFSSVIKSVTISAPHKFTRTPAASTIG